MSETSLDASVLSWNIQRYDAPRFLAKPWPQRAAGVTRRLRAAGPAIICLQEVLQPVRADIEDALPHHRWIGVGRDDGVAGGEYAPVLFCRSAYRLRDSGWFWLSRDPARPSIGWDAKLPRIATWVRLTAADGRSFLVFNTHFDHRGRRAREQAAWLLAREAIRLGRGDPCIITGDFNARATDRPLRTLQLFLTNGALDRRGATSGAAKTHALGRIDHVLYSRQFSPITAHTEPAAGLSDHASLHYVLQRRNSRPAPAPMAAVRSAAVPLFPVLDPLYC